MNTKYFALLTHAGTGKLEKAASSGHKLEITHMAVGDGGGSLVTPHASQSKLINEIHRAEINTFTINPQNSNQIIAEQIIPEGKGNWWIREMGLFDKDGTLIAVGNCADLYKPESQEQTIHMNLTVSGNGLTDWIKGLISGLATRQYVRDKIKEHTESRNHPDATLTQKGFVALNSAVNSDAETHAATPKAIKTAYELANKAYELATTISSTDKYVPVTRKINGKELSRDIGLTAQDVDAYDKIQTNSLVDGAKHVANTAIDIANTKVPLSRKVNGKELVNDVELSALDVNAYSRQDTDGLIETVNKLANTANQNAIHALKQAEQNVPQTRKVNNKELTTDIQLTVDDIGTYNKKEIEDRISTVQLSAETANKNATTAIQQAEKSVPLTRKVNNKELVTDIHLTAGDIGTYDKKDIEDRISTVQLSAETANKNATTAIQQAEKSVPLTRKVNNKELVTDIHLTAGDIGTYDKKDIEDRISTVQLSAETANKNATTAIQQAEKSVPSIRKVNNKELVTDIHLTAGDIGTYDKKEIEDRIGTVQLSAETANKNATTAIQQAEKSVPLTRKVNNKELVTDIHLTAGDIGTYDKKDIEARIGTVQLSAETANKNATTAIQQAEKSVPLTRKVNNKELVTDIHLTAGDIGTYDKKDIEDRISTVQLSAETANKNATTAIQQAEKSVPSIRKVNNKELVTDIHLTAGDIGTYDKSEINDQVGKVNELAKTANSNAISAIQHADKKVPLTRNVNGKELSTDIELTATDVDAYNKAETNILIDEVKDLANHANNNAETRVPMTRTVNGKALLSDIKLTASDINAYTKGEVDSRIEDVKDLANSANNNADGRVPQIRTVNGKSLSSDIKLTASDVGAYTKTDVDTRISKVETLANQANTNAITAKNNADGRLEKSQNGADIPDKQAFVKNLGLADLAGLSIESRRIGDNHTIIKLGDISMINGFAVGSEPIGEFNVSVIGGVTYYTHFYKIKLPVALQHGIISCHASIVGDNFDNQSPGHLADVKTRRDNSNGVGLSKDTLTISVTTPQLGWVPHFYYQVVGY